MQREGLVLNNTNLVHHIYWKYFSGYAYYHDDLIQEGMIGLCKAANTYKEDKKCSFSTYACRCILNQMHMFASRKKYISKEIAISRLKSIDSILDKAGNNYTPEEILLSLVTSKYEAEYQDLDEIVALRTALDKLPVKQYFVIHSLIFKGMRQKELAEKVGVAQTSISRIYHKAIETLKKEMM